MVAMDIELQKVSKGFGALVALHPTELSIPKGQYVLIVGSNGAGKTTLLRLTAGVSQPSSGQVLICGQDMRTNAECRANIGLLSHHSMLYEDLTAEENLLFFSQLYGLDEACLQVERSLELMDLSRWRHQKINGFSRGMRQRLAIARATIHNPSIILLDEPYTGLDPVARKILQNLLVELKARGHTILMATHRLEEAAPLADRVIVVESGSIVFDQTWQGTGRELVKLFEFRKEQIL
jgi:heme exporter protein A